MDGEMSEQGQRYRQILTEIISIAADAIIMVDQDQRIILFNAGAEAIFGWSHDEILGKPLDVLLPERFRMGHRHHLPDFGEEPDPARKFTGPRPGIVGLRKNGEEFPGDAAISKLRDAGAWIYTVVLRDITEQKRIEREKSFLAEIGPVLATSLDLEVTVTNIGRLAVRDIADFCIVDLNQDDEVRHLKVASRDPSKAWLCELLAQIPLESLRSQLWQSVLESRRSILLQSAPAETYSALAQSEAYYQALQAAEIRSMMAVPLMVHARLLGAMVFLSSRASRVFGPADVELAEGFAQRAALSIENARLYRAAQRAAETRMQCSASWRTICATR